LPESQSLESIFTLCPVAPSIWVQLFGAIAWFVNGLEANPKVSQEHGLKGNTGGTRAIEPAPQRILARLPDRRGSIGKSKRFIIAIP